MADIFTGTYKVSKRDNFDEFLQELNINVVKRKMAHSFNPERRIARDGDEWQVQEKAGLKNREWRFKMGEEFELMGVDDVKRKCIVTEDNDNKWTEILTPVDSEKGITVTYEFGEKQLVATQTIGDVTAVITYDRR